MIQLSLVAILKWPLTKFFRSAATVLALKLNHTKLHIPRKLDIPTNKKLNILFYVPMFIPLTTKIVGNCCFGGRIQWLCFELYGMLHTRLRWMAMLYSNSSSPFWNPEPYSSNATHADAEDFSCMLQC